MELSDTQAGLFGAVDPDVAKGALAAAKPGFLSVGSLPQADRHWRKFDAILSIQDPIPKRNQVLRIRDAMAPRLVLAFEDVDEASGNLWTADEADAGAILEFGRLHRDAALLVHCHVGIARSTAAALGIMADRLGPGREREAVSALLQVRPAACPNRVLMDRMDALLGRQGALRGAWDAWEETRPKLAEFRDMRRKVFEKYRSSYQDRPQAGECFGFR